MFQKKDWKNLNRKALADLEEIRKNKVEKSPLAQILLKLVNPEEGNSPTFSAEYGKNDAIIIQGLCQAMATRSINGCKSAVDRAGTVNKYAKALIELEKYINEQHSKKEENLALKELKDAYDLYLEEGSDSSNKECFRKKLNLYVGLKESGREARLAHGDEAKHLTGRNTNIYCGGRLLNSLLGSSILIGTLIKASILAASAAIEYGQ